MRYDTTFNYDYLLEKIQNKYKQNTIMQNIFAFCKDVYYFTPYRFRRVVLLQHGYFLTNEIVKMSKALDLTDEEILKCFFTLENDNK